VQKAVLPTRESAFTPASKSKSSVNTFFAIPTAAVGDVERQDNPIALLQQRDSRADLGHYSHVLVAEDQSAFSRSATLVHAGFDLASSLSF
jgi:hypothetical protein